MNKKTLPKQLFPQALLLMVMLVLLLISLSCTGKRTKPFFQEGAGIDWENETLDFYIDNNGPEIGIQFGIGSIGEGDFEGETVNVYPPKTSVFITATDQLVGYDKIFYSVNKSAEIESKGIIKNMKIGKYGLKVRALDKLGNETRKELKFIIQQ